MAGTRVMETYAARLASFSITYPLSKKRSSDSKGSKSMRWRHKSPAPAELARAGFFYRPTPSNPDNAQCFLCEYNLDGWEEDDDAIVEHLKHSPDCGWAIIVSLEAEIDSENLQLDDPLCEKLLNAREMTFGSSWPHETKKGWVCKTQKMIESGWYYSPMEEGDDFVRCSYCSLALDGWERKDNPCDEHQRRSPDCKFFSLTASTKPKTGRPRKSRVSKVSRKSMQSNFSILSEEASLVEGEIIEDHSGFLHTAETEKPTKARRGWKKAAKTKKPSAKAKTKVLKKEVEEPSQASSYIEPEDDDFEVKVEEMSAKNVKSKKRSSDEMNDDSDMQQLDVERCDVHSQPPPTKRQATRARSSVMETKNMPTPFFQNGHENDTLMTDAECAVPLTAPASKKGTKRGRKRASSTVRKASARSTASVAPLRRVPDDNAIDAALEADLDRPLTDDDDAAMQPEPQEPKTRRLTRTRPGSRNGPASVANVRRSTRASNMTDRGITADEQKKETQDVKKSTQFEQSSLEGNRGISPLVPVLSSQAGKDDSGHETDVSVIGQGPKKRKGKKGPGVVKKGKSGKKSLPAGRNIEEIIQPTIEHTKVGEREDASYAMAIDMVLDVEAGSVDSGLTQEASQYKKTVVESTMARSAGATPISLSPRQSSLNGEAKEITSPVASTFSIEATEEPSRPLPSPTTKETTMETPPPAPLPAKDSIPLSKTHTTPRIATSPQSSDAENQPPSSRPSATRPPILMKSPSMAQTIRIPLASATPASSPSKRNASRLQSSAPWTAVELEKMFLGSPTDKENNFFVVGDVVDGVAGELGSPEKKLSVGEWVQFNAKRGEAKLRNECERIVGKFEGEGIRALRTLEGIVCID